MPRKTSIRTFKRELVDERHPRTLGIPAILRFSRRFADAERQHENNTGFECRKIAAGMSGYEEEMREFLSYVLQSYEMQGVQELEPTKLSDFLRIRYGGMNDAKRKLGSIDEIRGAFFDIQKHLYQQEV